MLTERGNIYAFGQYKDDKLALAVGKQGRFTETPQMITDDRNQPISFWHEAKCEVLTQLYPQFGNYTPVWTLRSDSQVHAVIQVCATEKNQFFVTNQGKLFVSGVNDSYQCGGVGELDASSSNEEEKDEPSLEEHNFDAHDVPESQRTVREPHIPEMA